MRFFRGTSGAFVVLFFSMVSFFASTRQIRSGVGVIDGPDQFEQVFEQYDISQIVFRKCSFLVFSRLV